MRNQNQLLIRLAALVVLTLVAGTLGYHLIEDGWSLFDGFYMTLITLTTIGYSEVHPLSPAGRVFTTVLIVIGLGAAAAVVGQFARIMIEDNLSAKWRNRRMVKQISRMKNHVIICGFGRIGNAISRELGGMGIPCVIIDRDDSRSEGSRTQNLPTVMGNATSDETLIEAGIKRASILVAALSNDSDNLFVALAARDLNRDLTVIARGEDKGIETRMLRAGVDRVVYPAQLGGGQIARLVGDELGHVEEESRSRRLADVMGYDLQIFRNFRQAKITVQEILATTEALEIAAVIDSEGRHHTRPAADHEVKSGETAVLLVETVSTPHLEAGDIREAVSMGIPGVDEEHVAMLEMVNRIRGAGPSREGSKRVAQLLSELQEYTLKHFHHEEQLMLSVDYPGTEHHMEQHRFLAGEFDRISGDIPNLDPVDLAGILETWISTHIEEVDRLYAEHLNKIEV